MFADEGQRIFIDLVKCKGHDYCRSDKEMEKFFRDKFLYILSN